MKKLFVSVVGILLGGIILYIGLNPQYETIHNPDGNQIEIIQPSTELMVHILIGGLFIVSSLLGGIKVLLNTFRLTSHKWQVLKR